MPPSNSMPTYQLKNWKNVNKLVRKAEFVIYFNHLILTFAKIAEAIFLGQIEDKWIQKMKPLEIVNVVKMLALKRDYVEQ